jgi:signal transduction histidine kinase
VAVETDTERFFGGARNCELIVFSGIVHRIRDAENHWRIVLSADSRTFSVFIAKPVLADALGLGPAVTEAALAELLVDAVVRVTGPATLRIHDASATFEPQVNVARPAWFEVVSPPPQPAFEAPLVPLESLGRQRPWQIRGHRVRTRGVVIHAIPTEAVFLQSAGVGVRVETPASEPFRPGDEIEAAGFIVRRGRRSGLADAAVRRIGATEPPAPLDIRPPIESDFTRNEGLLVRLAATLLDARPTRDGMLLTLTSGTAQVTAQVTGLVPAEAAPPLGRLTPGAVLSVTGIGETTWRFQEDAWPQQVPDRLRLIVRSAADVQVERDAPWWTPGRLAALLGLVVAALVAAIAWTVALRHRLRLQTARLAAEMRSRRDAAVEFQATLQERNRLAANLHDTLLQTLGGIGFQLDACEGCRSRDEAEAREHFAVARRMVNHAAGELHGAVWAMRSLPLEERSFPEALKSLVARVGEGHPATIDVLARGPLDDVPEFVAGILILIVQEAVFNALRHGRPRQIGVEVDADLTRIRATVRDDGAGFAAPAGQGPEDRGAQAGHFGLLGMRERAERLGGSLRIESRPGRGTTVTAEVRRSEFDRNLAEPQPAVGG